MLAIPALLGEHVTGPYEGHPKPPLEVVVVTYIETFYNTVRSHSHCGYLSPDQYEEAYYAALDEKAEALAG